uniref:hypothetical protein n=1 Tax=Gracilaria usneoides TaxID=172951 RepID=UPI001D121226|nr:hypothetical protein LK225_pgp122 [Crassiphycus usneoides]UAD88623.1 hypothetical protein [Crassiphycus usneoides]
MVKNLDLLPNKILNLYALESNILFLKKEKIISSCSYNISNLPEGLIVNIKYSLHNNQVKYIYIQENTGIFENNTLMFLRNLLNKLVLFKPQKSYILEFKYKLNFIRILQIKLKTSVTLPHISIKLSLLKIMSDCIDIYFSYIYYIIYYYKFTYNYNYIQIINSNPCIKYISNLRIKTKNLKVELQYRLDDKINMIQKLIMQYEEKHFISIYNYSYINIQINNNHYLYNTFKLIRSKELYLLFILKYPAFKHSNFAKNSVIYINLLFHYDTQIIKYMSYIINLYPYIFLSYNKIFNLPLVLPNIYKNTIQLNIKAYIFDITKNLMAIKSFSNTYDEYINRRNSYNSKLINKTNYWFNIKYKIYPIKYVAIYLLISYTKNISYQILYLSDIYKSKLIYQDYYQIGMGMNLYSPFRQIPIVFIEYFTNNKYENFIYIGTNFS